MELPWYTTNTKVQLYGVVTIPDWEFDVVSECYFLLSSSRFILAAILHVFVGYCSRVSTKVLLPRVSTQ